MSSGEGRRLVVRKDYTCEGRGVVVRRDVLLGREVSSCEGRCESTLVHRFD